ncbi:hypothetical protein I316_04887 [Kwoniella heveanensis BCC8398]|uniref:Protein CPL1-like domain-containing protein n=1 Tax=Kwoniella heveanensis BCC8398 TaxID=1296120 RepID=A0A1B9GR20_9TREE|nr:hypothetical protein I316_04887 [Kwoniella heveanensis BCC8398]
MLLSAPRSLLGLLSVTLSLANYALAAATPGPTFAGCVLATSLTTNAGSSGGQAGGYYSSLALCNSHCAQTGYQFAYYITGTIGTATNCYCHHVGYDVSSVNYAVPNGGILGSDTACLPLLQAAKYDVSTTFVFQNCVGTLTGVTVNLLTGQLLGGSLVADPHACFVQCANSAQAYFIPFVPTGAGLLPTYGCVCNPSGQGQALLCGATTFYRYAHMPGASGQARRRQLEARYNQNNKMKRKSFCPGRMKACVIPEAEDSWECIDAETDLESCGGCVHSEYGAQPSPNGTFPASGIDCTTLPGVRLGGATCTNGECQIFSCKRKWTLKNGRCVRQPEREAPGLVINP